MAKRLLTFIIFMCVALCAAAVPAYYRAGAFGVVSDNYEIADYAGEAGFSVYVGADGCLYTAGSNGSGELGRGLDNSVVKAEPLTVKVLTDVIAVDTGKTGFVIATTKDGTLYAWGSNEFGQAGGDVTVISTGNKVTSPQKVDMPDGAAAISDVQAGARHSLVLTDDGKIYAFGSNNLGQLGLGLEADRRTLTSRPTLIDPSALGGGAIAQIACCEYTSFALTGSGEVYAWGDGMDGLLLNDEEYSTVPVRLPLTGVTKISAQSTTVMALTADGRVLVWGNNGFGQYGIPDLDENGQAPYEISSFYTETGEPVDITVKDIICGGVSSFVLSADGDVYGFGKAGAGELGFNPRTATSPFVVSQNTATAPTRLTFYTPLSVEDGQTAPVDMATPVSVNIDKFAGSAGVRTFALDDEGQMWAWGDNANGMVCSGSIDSVYTPVRATLYRTDNYDKEIKEKDYTRQPIIGLSIIGAFAVLFIVWTEIKRASVRRLEKNA